MQRERRIPKMHTANLSHCRAMLMRGVGRVFAPLLTSFENTVDGRSPSRCTTSAYVSGFLRKRYCICVRRLFTSATTDFVLLKSLRCTLRCSVRWAMRFESSAICTSGDPVSDALLLNWFTASVTARRRAAFPLDACSSSARFASVCAAVPAADIADDSEERAGRDRRCEANAARDVPRVTRVESPGTNGAI